MSSLPAHLHAKKIDDASKPFSDREVRNKNMIMRQIIMDLEMVSEGKMSLPFTVYVHSEKGLMPRVISSVTSDLNDGGYKVEYREDWGGGVAQEMNRNVLLNLL